MAILSTFDPKLEKDLFRKAEKEFWKDNIVLVKKSRLYIINIVIIPLLLIAGIFSWVVIFLASVLNIESIIFKVILWIFWLLFLLVCFQLFNSALTYYMDFILFTPQSFTKNKQNWFFKRDLKIVDLDHIRSVYVQKKWLVQSILNVWWLVISLDWYEEKKDDNHNNIRFRYVRCPEEVCEKIETILWKL